MRNALIPVIVVLVSLTGMGRSANAGVLWTENFDDGNISDWTVENPYGGYSAVTLEPSTEQSVSPLYALKASGPSSPDGYGGQAWGPTVSVDLEQPYTIRFKFRYTAAHWYHIGGFGPVYLTLDQPSGPLKYNIRSGVFGNVGTDSFNTYCPPDTWTEFRIDVRPAVRQYDVWVDGVLRGTATYDASQVADPRFQMREDGEAGTNYVSNAYYDDVEISGETQFYWKAGGWADYAPSGVPDFDQKQGSLQCSGRWSHCGPAAVADSFWWFDSKLEPSPVAPPAVNDNYPLVQSLLPETDDHAVESVVPLIAALAGEMNTNNNPAPYPCGTLAGDMQLGIEHWLLDHGLASSYSVAMLVQPTFDEVAAAVTQSHDVVLLLGFWENQGGTWVRLGGHYVTAAGVDDEGQRIAFSDPFEDTAAAGTTGGRVLGDGSLTYDIPFNVPAPSGSFLISLPREITSPPITSAKLLVEALVAAGLAPVSVGEYRSSTDTWLTYPAGFPGSCSPCGTDPATCFCIDPLEGAAYWVGLQAPLSGTLSLRGVDSTSPVMLPRATPGVSLSGRHAISLPFSSPLATALDLLNDIGTAAMSVSRLDPSTSSFQTRTRNTGPNFSIVPGEGYVVQMSANATYTPATTADPPSSDAQNVSHDAYDAVAVVTPGGLWGPEGYADTLGAAGVQNFACQNLASPAQGCGTYQNGPVVTVVENAIEVAPVTDEDGDGVLPPADCDDSNPHVYPGAPEICDGVNNNCSDSSWPTVPANELDHDGDRFVECQPWLGGGSVIVGGGDCDDTRVSVYPGALQVCDGVPNNCNDPSWPTVPANELDHDGDRFVECQPWLGGGSVIVGGGDCDEIHASIGPGVLEICDEADNNCNGSVDEGCTAHHCVQWQQITSGSGFSCGLSTSGIAACWGKDYSGEASPPPVAFTSIAAGGDHACGLTTDGAIVCWGDDSQGQNSPPAGTFASVSAGSGYACALRVDGTLVCWGANGYGKATPPQGAFTSVTAGYDHTCAIRPDHTLECWGRNDYDQVTVPSGSMAAVAVGLDHTCGLSALPSSCFCWGGSFYHQTQCGTSEYTYFGAGLYHNCGIHAAGTVGCFGDNRYDQSWNEPGGTFVSLGVGAYHNCGLKTDGTVVCWGSDWFGENPSPRIEPSGFRYGVVGFQYAESVWGMAGVPPYHFTVVAGSLPPGVSLGSGGVLTGLPTVAGHYAFTVRGIDAYCFVALKSYTIEILADCDDGNPCSDDPYYEPGVGCVRFPNTESCDDGDFCTDDDVCEWWACHGTPKDCDDGNACTWDACSSATGECAHTPISCNDQNSCTDDSCDSATGCVYTPDDTNACTDDNLCTSPDVCVNGSCVVTPLSCDDSDGCTTDSCLRDRGCTNTWLEISGLGWSDKTTLVWDAIGPSASYDVARGIVTELPILGSGASETCIAQDIAQTTKTVNAVPASQATFWFLVRATDGICGLGSYGFRYPRGLPPVERTTAICP